MEINILVHGNSEGYNSEFMQYVAKHLEQSGKKVLGFDFNYIDKGLEPSDSLRDEFKQLKKVIQDQKEKGYENINLIGKSLGGTICLIPDIVNDKSIKNILVIGFPIILGFPADLALLKNKPIQVRKWRIEKYRKLFEEFGKDTKKITIIQGEDDLLGDKKTIKSFLSSLSVKPKVLYVENASHGFKPVREGKSFYQNMGELGKIVLSRI